LRHRPGGDPLWNGCGVCQSVHPLPETARRTIEIRLKRNGFNAFCFVLFQFNFGFLDGLSSETKERKEFARSLRVVIAV